MKETIVPEAEEKAASLFNEMVSAGVDFSDLENFVRAFLSKKPDHEALKGYGIPRVMGSLLKKFDEQNYPEGSVRLVPGLFKDSVAAYERLLRTVVTQTEESTTLGDELEKMLKPLGRKPIEMEEVEYGQARMSLTLKGDEERANIINGTRSIQLSKGTRVAVIFLPPSLAPAAPESRSSEPPERSRSELRRSVFETEKPELGAVLTQAAAKVVLVYYRGYIFKISLGAVAVKAALKALLGSEALAQGTLPQGFIPRFSQEALQSLGSFPSHLSSPFDTPERLIDYRSSSPQAEELLPLLLYTLAHPEDSYTLVFTTPLKGVRELRGQLHALAQGRFKASLPQNFRVVSLKTSKALLPTLRKLVSLEETPVSLVSEVEEPLGKLPIRNRFLRVKGSKRAEEQTASLLLSVPVLQKDLSLIFFARVYTGKELGQDGQFEALVLALQVGRRFLVAA
jgi:hypothetical protein